MSDRQERKEDSLPKPKIEPKEEVCNDRDFTVENLCSRTAGLSVAECSTSPFGCPMSPRWEVWLKVKIKPNKDCLIRTGQSLAAGYIAYCWHTIHRESGKYFPKPFKTQPIVALRYVPDSRREQLIDHIAGTSDICLTFPDDLDIPRWWWYKDDYYFVRLKLNSRTMASFRVLELSENPPNF